MLATGQNRQNTEADITWHAEFDALRVAARTHGAGRVTGATVYSTMEPCPMCAGAMKLAGIARLVLGLRHATLARTDTSAAQVQMRNQVWAGAQGPVNYVTGSRSSG